MFKGVSGKEAYAGDPQSEKIQDRKNSFSKPAPCEHCLSIW